MPEMALDHLLVAAPDLQSGSAFVHQHLGVAPVAGGVHPGMGTRNALLGLSGHSYIEVIAPDPLQSPDLAMSHFLGQLKAPALMWWAVRCHKLKELEKQMRRLGVKIVSIQPWSRSLPDGSKLHWRLLIAEETSLGTALPFFIEWQDMARHPARNLPSAGFLDSMQIAHPNIGRLQSILGTGCWPGLSLSNSLRPALRVEIDNGHKTVTLMMPAQFPPGLGSILGSKTESEL